MSTIDELRGLVEKAKQYLEQAGPDHDWGCPGDDTCDCETGSKQKAVDKLVQIAPALLAVAEAARGMEWVPMFEESSIKSVDRCPCCTATKREGHATDCDLADALDSLDSLARLDGEVGP